MHLLVNKVVGFHSHTQGRWSPRLPPLLTKLADLLLNIELFWAIPALIFTFASLLWGMSYSWAGLVIASIPFLMRRWRKGYFSHRTPFDLPVGLFLVAALIGLFVSPAWGLSLRAFQSALACILLYYILVNIPHAGYVQLGCTIAGAGVLAVTLLAFDSGFTPPPIATQFGTWVQQQLQHLPQISRSPSAIAIALTPVHGLAIVLEMVLIPLIGISLFAGKMPGRLIATTLSLLFLTPLLLFGSQGAWLAVGVGTVFLLLWRSRWSLLPVSAAAGIGYWAVRNRWFAPQLFFLSNPESSLKGRVELWQRAMEVIREHPLTGSGLGYLGQNFASSPYLNPHNAYLQFYADTGIIGALASLSALIILFKIALNLLGSSRAHPWYGFAIGVLATILAVGVHGLFEASPAGILAGGTDSYYYIFSPVFWILAGLLVRTQHMLQSDKSGTRL